MYAIASPIKATNTKGKVPFLQKQLLKTWMLSDGHIGLPNA